MTQPSPQALIDALRDYPDLRKALRMTADGTVVGRFYEFDLASGFQRIVRLGAAVAPDFSAPQPVVAYDAYARSRGQSGDTISPWGLFSRAAEDATVVWLDRLCRVVHTVNYVSQEGSGVPLHLRVHGRLLAAIVQDHGHAFRDMLDAMGVATAIPRLAGQPEALSGGGHAIVLQLPDTATYDADLAGQLIRNYRHHGFGIALQASGAALAVARIKAYAPDVMKVDVRTLGPLEQQVPPLLRAAEHVATQIVFTRIDNPVTAQTLAALGAHFGQGYTFDLPAATLAAVAVSA
ncbi:hypothetical protein GCM10007242_47510 [Pigmentiphaga litoralis]|uniref:EAL domain-containing protein n=1 Tax=Pigmentiphaga litoralis TaxID=516702 RepID=UPI00167B1332|nr:EAL domain-containing protein [Pigmentiphaga litoralis]GGX35030.1 hypothetical protein GCM10007242_47510 [Pigmentiphaga litoralis]